MIENNRPSQSIKFIFFAIIAAVNVSTTQAEVLIFDILQDDSVTNFYPGTDGLIGTADDQLSAQRSPMNLSGANENGSFSYNAFDFGTGLTDAPLMPPGFNAITFLEGSVAIDTEGFSMNGPNFANWNVSGTEPFLGHGPYSFQTLKENSFTYNIATGAFTINIDFTANLIGGSAIGLDFDFAGEAWLVDSVDFGTFDKNSYVRDVLIPMAQAAGASKLVYISGSGTSPASSGGTGGSFPQMPVKGAYIGIYKLNRWVANDFNGDKRSDLPWRNQDNGQNRLWLMRGAMREVAGSIPPIAPDWTVAGTGDFDMDGKVDIYWRNQASGINRIWFMDGLARTGFAATLRMIDTAWQVAAICDLNHDGTADIIWRHSTLPRTRVWTMVGAIQTGKAALPIIDNAWLVAGCADFDGDGNADILWRHVSNGQNRIWFMQGVTRVKSGSINIISNAFRVGGVGDFTKDGNADILFQNDANGHSRLWAMDGLKRLSQTTLPQQNKAFRGAAIGDFGGDGKLDIFWRNHSNGKNQIWNMDGALRMSLENVVAMPTGFSAVPKGPGN